jgi:MFS family permease
MALSMKSTVRMPPQETIISEENHKAEDIEKEASSLYETSTESLSSPREPEPPLPQRISRVSIAENALSRIASHLTTKSIRDPGPPPDGGFTAWLHCFLCWLVILNTWGFVLSFGAFQTYYSSVLNMNPSTVSWIGSVQAWLMFFLGAFSGRALDAGLYRPTIIIGILFQLIGVFTMSLSTKYWQLFITQGLLFGIGGGIFFCPVIGLLSTYFSKHRGLAMGLATSGNSTGGIIFPVIVQQLLPKIGFAWTVRVLGFVNLVSLVLVIAFTKPRLPPRKSGPVIEWSAAKDVPYALFVLAVFLLVGAVYWMFYYVSNDPVWRY